MPRSPQPYLSQTIHLPCDEVYKLGGKLCKLQGIFNIDVNGLKGPNKLGRDVFRFYISDDSGTVNGEGCGARVMAEGWKMNY